MENSLLKEVNKKNLEAYLKETIYDSFYWPTFFPIKSTPLLTYETLIGEEGARIAADVVAYDSEAPLKTRRVISKLSGEIPPIRVKRKMTETDLNTYNILKAQAEGADQESLLDLVFNDVDFVVNAVNARLEWLALSAMSYGSITLAATNNNGIVTENAIDFQVPTGNKSGVAVTWSTGATCTPLTDIRTVVDAADAVGVKLQYILMRRATFNKMKISTEFLGEVSFYLTARTGLTKAPNLEQTNAFLVSEGLPKIVLIEQSVGIENDDHTISYANPWKNNYITYIPQVQLGRTLAGPIAEETNPPKQVVQAKKGNILVSKYSSVDPVAEYTKGEINAFPSWNNVDYCYLQYVENTSWA